MKVLVVTHSYYPALRLGGPAKSIHILNKYLVKLGVNVTVLTTDTGINERDIKLKSWNEIDGVNVKYYKTYGNSLYNISPKMFIDLSKLVDESDIVHITPVWNFPCIAAGITCMLKNKKFIISPRGTLNKESFDIKNKLLKQIYYKVIAERMIVAASNLHFTSDDEMNNVMLHLKLNNDSRVIHNGIELDEYKYINLGREALDTIKDLDGCEYILFLGRIHKKKGLKILLQTFKRINENNHNIKLVIAGFDNDGYQSELESLASSLNIVDDIKFTGPLHAQAITRACQNALCFVLPSYTENFGMAVVEAMASGCPVVISNKVGIYDLIQQNNAGIVVEPHVDSLYDGLMRILNDFKLREVLTDNGRRLVKQRFDIRQVSREMLSLYESTLS